MVLDADGGAAKLVSDAHGGNIHFALLDDLVFSEVGLLVFAEVKFHAFVQIPFIDALGFRV